MARRGGLQVGVMGQFVMLALAWGASFLFIKAGLEGLSPPQVVLGRLLAGAGALAVVSLVGRRPLPRELAVWGHLAVVSVTLRRYDTDGRRSDEHRAARKPALSVQRKRRDCPARTTIPPRDLQR